MVEGVRRMCCQYLMLNMLKPLVLRSTIVCCGVHAMGSRDAVSDVVSGMTL
jgi:hypothetical protein